MKILILKLVCLVIWMNLYIGSTQSFGNSFDSDSNSRNRSSTFELYARGVTYTSSGHSLRGSDGSVWMISGHLITGHEKSYVKNGHSITGHGVTFTLSGNMIRGTNGVTCVVSGSTTQCR